jgi:hypothetical protein
MTLEFKYPGAILVILLAAVYFAVRLYMSKDELDRASRSLIFYLKYLFLALFVLFAFDPVSVRSFSEEVPLKTLILFDNSASITLNNADDAAGARELASLAAGRKEYDIYLFGDSLKKFSEASALDFKDRFSNISGKDLSDAVEKFSLDPGAGSVLLVTDGNFGDADNFSLKQKLPVNIIFTSPASEYGDIFINDLIYTENPTPDEEKKASAVVGFRGKTADRTFTLKVSENGKAIKTVKGEIPPENSFVQIPLDLPAMLTDFRELEFRIEPLTNENNLFNNKKNSYQRKTVSSSKLLLAAPSPSLDVSFFAKLLKDNGYTFDLVTGKAVGELSDTGKYSALIAFGLPDKNSGAAFEKLSSSFPGRIFFTNKNTDLRKLDLILKTGLGSYKYTPANGRIVKISADSGFLFRRNNEYIDLKESPGVVYNPVFMPSSPDYKKILDFEAGGGAAAAYRNSSGGNVIIINASSVWMPLFNDNSGQFGKLLMNIVDLVLTEPEADRVKISPSKNEYAAGEKIIFSGKIFDANMRETGNAQAELFIDGAGIKSDFITEGKGYSSGLHIYEPGIYTGTITVSGAGGSTLKKKIKFTVKENDAETSKLGSDSLFLKSFAAARNGKALPLKEGREMIEDGIGKKRTVTKETQFKITRNIYFFLILTLIFIVELAVRKYKDLS